MSIVEATPAVETGDLVEVQIVDSDVHPSPRPGALLPYLPEDIKRFLPRGREMMEIPNYYDVPDFANSSAMRADAFPPGGGFPGTDPDFATQQLLREAKVDIGILEPLGGQARLPEVEHALKTATNYWLEEVWLSAAHKRWRGSISVSARSPQLAAGEIDRWAGHPLFAQVLMTPQTGINFGDPHFDPIYEAAARHNLPICTHLIGLGPYETTPLMPFGNQGHWADFMAAWPLLFTTHLMSLVFDGAFERHPNLRVLFVEGAFTWVLPTLWRMDRVWEANREDLPHVKRRPSEIVREHVRFTTQPLEEPEDAAEYRRYLEWLDAGEMLLFSTDYPHWSYDEPAWAVQQFPPAARERIMWRNATEFFNLPRMVPALV
jgi:predicted TIM-barrel fold metal-dependent hydrolase